MARMDRVSQKSLFDGDVVRQPGNDGEGRKTIHGQRRKVKQAQFTCRNCHRYLRVGSRNACSLTHKGNKGYRFLPSILNWPENFNCFWRAHNARQKS